MKNDIHILPKSVYQLIAAGEVVERPSSVIKEMMENSIDAGAQHITVEIKNGGITYMRVTDDGCGIDKSQIKKVFVPHATSKIEQQEDLNSISTLGFRGEAMASIGAVANVEVLTRTAGSDSGTRYEVRGGSDEEPTDAGCPVGTTIVVRDLFFNTPARMKFLKSDKSEGNAVAAVVDRVALSHPEISFRFIRDGKPTLTTGGTGDLKNTIYSIFGKELTQSLITADYTYDNMSVKGYVSKPSASRKSRQMQFFFINGRLVKSLTMMAALEQAYKNSVMVGRYPACVLDLTINPSLVDVNVHPAKLEVRFASEKPVFDIVYFAVKNAIASGDSVKSAVLKEQKVTAMPEYRTSSDKIKNQTYYAKKDTPVQTRFSVEPKKDFFGVKSSRAKYNLDIEYTDNEPKEHKVELSEKTADDKSAVEKENIQSRQAVSNISDDNFTGDSSQKNNTTSDVADNQEALPKSNDNAESKVIDEVHNAEYKDNQAQQSNEINDDSPMDFRLVGQAFSTYIIIESGKSLYLIDKHAAHERINYERLRSGDDVGVQMLLTPVTVKLSKQDFAAVTDNIELIEKCGFDIEEFGLDSVIVRAIPALANDSNVADMICEMAQSLNEHKTDIEPKRLDWIYHSTACRSAVKAGDFTSNEEAELFVKRLLSMPNIRYCPHGRPVMIKLSKYEIEKQFGRVT